MQYDDVTSAGEVRRIEVFTGSGPRRRWSAEEKDRIVAESYAGAGTVCDVARRHGLAPTQLFTWWREARLPTEPPSASMFAPVLGGVLGDACEDVGEPGLRIDVVELGGDDQAIHRRGALPILASPIVR